jgi:hypothetical protein
VRLVGYVYSVALLFKVLCYLLLLIYGLVENLLCSCLNPVCLCNAVYLCTVDLLGVVFAQFYFFRNFV